MYFTLLKLPTWNMCDVLVVKCTRGFYGMSVAMCWLADLSVSMKNDNGTCELKDCFGLMKYSDFVICCKVAHGWRSNCFMDLGR